MRLGGALDKGDCLMSQLEVEVEELKRQRMHAQRKLALLQADAHKLSKLFAGLASMLHPDFIWSLPLESYETLLTTEVREQIGRLRAELREAERVLAQLHGEFSKTAGPG